MFLALFAFFGGVPIPLGPFHDDRRLRNVLLLLVLVLGLLTSAALIGYYATDSWVGAPSCAARRPPPESRISAARNTVNLRGPRRRTQFINPIFYR